MSSDYFLRPVPGLKQFMKACDDLDLKPDYTAENANKSHFPITDGHDWVWVSVSGGKSPRVIMLTRFGANEIDIIFNLAVALKCRCKDQLNEWVDLSDYE